MDPRFLSIEWRGRVTSSQLSDGRTQCVGDGGADGDIGKADLLPLALDFLGGSGRREVAPASPPSESVGPKRCPTAVAEVASIGATSVPATVR